MTHFFSQCSIILYLILFSRSFIARITCAGTLEFNLICETRANNLSWIIKWRQLSKLKFTIVGLQTQHATEKYQAGSVTHKLQFLWFSSLNVQFMCSSSRCIYSFKWFSPSFLKFLDNTLIFSWLIVCAVSIDDLLEDSDDDESDDDDDEGKSRAKKKAKVWIKEDEEILDFSHPSAAQNITGIEHFIYFLCICLCIYYFFVDLLGFTWFIY